MITDGWLKVVEHVRMDILADSISYDVIDSYCEFTGSVGDTDYLWGVNALRLFGLNTTDSINYIVDEFRKQTNKVTC